jgi:hypothetical protein
MQILITAKELGNITGKNIQKVASEEKALNLVRSIMLEMQPMEETSADLKAMKFIQEVTGGQPKGIENEKNGRAVIFQIYDENEFAEENFT